MTEDRGQRTDKPSHAHGVGGGGLFAAFGFLVKLLVKQLAIWLTQQKTLGKPLVIAIRLSRQTTLAKSLVISSALCLLSFGVAAEETRPAYAPPPPAVSSGSILQIIFSLLLVLASVVLVAWLLKRMNVSQQGSGNLIKVLGGVSIGQRERIVLVEINDTWLVIGVGPGQIRTLHALQKSERPGQKTEDASPNTLSSENKFASLLSSVLSHRKPATGSK